MNHRLFCGIGVLFLSELLTGCSLISDVWHQDAIAQYGENTFRKQNLITSQIMMLSDADLSAENTQKVQQAESKMQKECKLLNEYAVREMDNAVIDLTFQKKVRDSISSCDASIQSAQTLLNQLGINE
jgi:hypothetical protein